MTDCFQLLRQLSDLYWGLIWLPGSKTIIFLIFTVLMAEVALWKPYMWNQNCLQIGRRSPRNSAGRLHKQDVEGNDTAFFYYYFIAGFWDVQLAHWMHILSSTVAKAIPRWLYRNDFGCGAVLAELVRGCNFCLFGGWSAPAQAVSLWKAVLSGSSMKWDSRLWTTKWDIKELEVLNNEGVNTELLNILQLHLPSSTFWLSLTCLCLLTLNPTYPQF